MTLIMYSENGIPSFVDSDDLPSSDGNPCFERLIEIAAAFQREGIEGVRVQCTPVDGGRFVITTSFLHGSLGADLLEFFANYARENKKIFSVDAALVIAKQVQENEVKNG